MAVLNILGATCASNHCRVSVVIPPRLQRRRISGGLSRAGFNAWRFWGGKWQ
ncbi:hypothetical protein [Sphingomonas sp. Leaf242]|uniref:hypothetical protein n=1 Tax=Sphingomonas sp. Leaf242 TaxID=1736304 RepID=UPI000A84B8D1|nr:hypothetical protein [Sphingomonas sp. Leaf242]